MADVLPTADTDQLTADSTFGTADGGLLIAGVAQAIRHSGDDYAEALAALFPTGPAWSRDPHSDLMRLVAGMAQIWGDVDGRAADLLERETDPRITLEMLPDWERAFGLPDPCVAEPLDIPTRRAAVDERLTTRGGQSIAFFQDLATRLGYTVTIRERRPFQCGVSRCGSSVWELGPPELRFVWVVSVPGLRVTRFHVGSGQVGVDPLRRTALATDLECLFRRWKPAHTDVVFSYS